MNAIVYNNVSIPDVDECQRDPMLCTNGVCRNSPGSFECICGDGYVLAKGTTACIGKRSEMQAVLCKISVQRSKYSLEIFILKVKLKMSGKPFHSSKIFGFFFY